MPQRPTRVAGFQDRIDETPWVVTWVRHLMDASGGYTSQVMLETQQAEEVEGQERAGSGD